MFRLPVTQTFVETSVVNHPVQAEQLPVAAPFPDQLPHIQFYFFQPTACAMQARFPLPIMQA